MYMGWKVRKSPAAVEVFFLTFSFIELIGSYLTADGRNQERGYLAYLPRLNLDRNA
jgi:hypothetical protein